MLPTKIKNPLSPNFFVICDAITAAIPAPSPGVTAVRYPEKQPDNRAFNVNLLGILLHLLVCFGNLFISFRLYSRVEIPNIPESIGNTYGNFRVIIIGRPAR